MQGCRNYYSLISSYFKIDRDLLYLKWIYLIEYAAFGSTSFLTIFYRYLGVPTSLIGIIRTFETILGLSGPLWGILSDRFGIHKILLYVTLALYIIFTFGIYFIGFATTHEWFANSSHVNGSLQNECTNFTFTPDNTNSMTFPLILLSICIASLSVAAVRLMTDTAALNYLGSERVDHYGKQRLWGGIGFGSFSALTGVIISYYCDIHVFFYVFLVLSLIHYISIIPFSIKATVSTTVNVTTTSIQEDDTISPNFDLGSNSSDSLKSLDTSDSSETSDRDDSDDLTGFTSPSPRASTMTRSFWTDLLLILKWKSIPLFYVVSMFGTANGILFTIVYIYLKDLGGKEDLIGYSVLVMCASEVFMFFISDLILKKIGNTKALYLAFICNCLRFGYYSLLSNPWAVLPNELLHGITWGLMWSAAVSISKEIAPVTVTTTMQGLLSAFYQFGTAMGSLFSGIIYHHYQRLAFQLASGWFALGLLGFLVLNAILTRLYAPEESSELDLNIFVGNGSIESGESDKESESYE